MDTPTLLIIIVVLLIFGGGLLRLESPPVTQTALAFASRDYGPPVRQF
jgi:hypothetical protein